MGKKAFHWTTCLTGQWLLLKQQDFDCDTASLFSLLPISPSSTSCPVPAAGLTADSEGGLPPAPSHLSQYFLADVSITVTG